MKISLKEAFNILRVDIRKYEREVLRAVKVDLNQHQFDALVSWHYNTGAISTATLTEKLNAGDYRGAANEFKRWNKGGGKVLKGLVKRRKHEAAIFRTGAYGSPQIRVFQKKGGTSKLLSIAAVKELFGKDGASEEDQTTEELIANPKSRLLPKYRPKQSEAQTRATLEAFKYLIPAERRNDAVFVLGVRGYYPNSMGKKGVNDRGVYDDALFVIEPGGVHNFNGNTDPSRYRKGIATLKAPQAVRYKPGPHGFSRKGGPYPAFRQDSRCTVIRDQKGEDTGIFWINIHRGGNTTTSSAGCQTTPPHQWNEFKALVDRLLDENGQKNFYYILIDNKDLAPEPKKASSSNKGAIVAAVAAGAAAGSTAMAQGSSWFLSFLNWLGF